MVAIFLHCHM